MKPANRPDLYQYTEYRTYLRDWFEQAKVQSAHFSYRYLSRKTEIDAGYLAHVFQSKKHLADTAVQTFCKLLAFDEKETRYFVEMVQFNKAKRESEIKDRFAKLTELRESNARVLNQQEYRYWMHWYIPAVRLTLLNIDFRGDFETLAQRITPSISAKQAQEAIEILINLNLIRINETGVYEVLDNHLYTGDAWTSAAIREFQSTTLELARESLRIHPPELREIATLTLAIPQDEIPTLQEMMRDFRSKIAKWAISLEDSNCVMQFNLATFPLSLPVSNSQAPITQAKPKRKKS